MLDKVLANVLKESPELRDGLGELRRFVGTLSHIERHLCPTPETCHVRHPAPPR